MRTIFHFISFFAAAVLASYSVTASADRVPFDSAARDSDFAQIFQAKTRYADHIYGDLQLPTKGSGPFPAMVIMHSSRGIDNSIGNWAKTFNEMGVATFVVDSFTPRGLTETSAEKFTFSAGVVDSLRALSLLQRDPRLDSGRIGVIDFSRGAIAAMDSGFNRYRTAVLGQDPGKFALHIAFHGGCAQYAQTTASPFLIFLGTNDDFNNLRVCRKDTEILSQQGTRVELVVYEGALHGFDTEYPRQVMPGIQNFKNCQMLLNLDTFAATLLEGRNLTAEERTRYSRSCAGLGAIRGGDPGYASAARERVKMFVAEHFALLR